VKFKVSSKARGEFAGFVFVRRTRQRGLNETPSVRKLMMGGVNSRQGFRDRGNRWRSAAAEFHFDDKKWTIRHPVVATSGSL